MRYFKKWYIILLVCVVTITAFESCSKHHRFKKMLKHRRSISVQRYHSPYQKKFKRKIQPINKNYIIRGGYREH